MQSTRIFSISYVVVVDVDVDVDVVDDVVDVVVEVVVFVVVVVIDLRGCSQKQIHTRD
jgi:hypothetical protein